MKEVVGEAGQVLWVESENARRRPIPTVLVGEFKAFALL